MSSSSQRSLRIIQLSVVCLAIYNIGLWFFSDATIFSQAHERHYTHIGNDFPHTFDVPDMGLVKMITEDTAHYDILGEHAEEEWHSLIPGPNHDGFIYLGPRKRPFIITMLHTIHCLNRMRSAIATTPPTESLRAHSEHCFNYVRQMTLCAADMRLQPETENVLQTTGSAGIDGLDLVHTCRDWSAAYRAVEQNQQEWIESGRHWEDYWNE